MLEVIDKDIIRIRQVYLEYREGSSNKFYRTLVIENRRSKLATLICAYGPIGRSGQSKVTHGMKPSEAYSQADKKATEKLRKGYNKAKVRDHCLIGSEDGLCDHTYLTDKLADKEANLKITNSLGTNLFEEIMKNDGWGVSASSFDTKEVNKKAKVAELKELEEARIATYGNSWGEWA